MERRMTQDEIIEMAKQVGMIKDGDWWFSSFYKTEQDVHISHLEAFAKLVAQHEREAISDEWWSCYQSDLENGVKSLNEYEAKKFAITYPELAKFGAWIEARGQA